MSVSSTTYIGYQSRGAKEMHTITLDHKSSPGIPSDYQINQLFGDHTTQQTMMFSWKWLSVRHSPCAPLRSVTGLRLLLLWSCLGLVALLLLGPCLFHGLVRLLHGLLYLLHRLRRQGCRVTSPMQSTTHHKRAQHECYSSRYFPVLVQCPQCVPQLRVYLNELQQNCHGRRKKAIKLRIIWDYVTIMEWAHICPALKYSHEH